MGLVFTSITNLRIETTRLVAVKAGKILLCHLLLKDRLGTTSFLTNGYVQKG